MNDDRPVPYEERQRERIRTLETKLHATEAVLEERERELFELKGPCSTDACVLHYAHAGPCDILSASEIDEKIAGARYRKEVAINAQDHVRAGLWRDVEKELLVKKAKLRD